MRKAALCAIALVASLASGTGEAALVDVALQSITVYGSNPRNLNLSASTATWQFNEFGHELRQTGGTYNAAYRFTPVSTVWNHVATDMILSPSSAFATSFSCVEGNYGSLVGNNYCAGYSFGPNFLDESTSSWGPGLTYSRTLGGDDYAFGGVFSLEVYNNFRLVSWDGTTLKFGNTGCFGGANCDSLPNGWNGGLLFTLQTIVPVPAAAWLFGSALGVLGWLRRHPQ